MEGGISRPQWYSASRYWPADKSVRHRIYDCIESVALDVLGFSLIGDVEPGEVVFIDQHGTLYRDKSGDDSRLQPCIFEHVYFARADSLMDGISIYKTRIRQGAALAKKYKTSS